MPPPQENILHKSQPLPMVSQSGSMRPLGYNNLTTYNIAPYIYESELLHRAKASSTKEKYFFAHKIISIKILLYTCILIYISCLCIYTFVIHISRFVRLLYVDINRIHVTYYKINNNIMKK